MNGTLSLFLLFWATFCTPSEAQYKTILLLASAGCFVWGSYHVWANERGRVVELESRRPDFFYQGIGSTIKRNIIMNPNTNTPVVIVDFSLRFQNNGATAYNISSNAYACWINDDPPTTGLADSTEPAVGRTLQGECRSIRFRASRDARQLGISGLGLKASDVLVILVEIRSRLSSNPDSPLYDNEPIWKTYDPRIHDRLCDAKESDVRVAKEQIDRLKKQAAKAA